VTSSPPRATWFVAWFAGVGLLIPFAMMALVRLLDQLPYPIAQPFAWPLGLLGPLLWPRVADALERIRVASADATEFLVIAAAMNAAAYAAFGALIWCAHYRRRWAWGLAAAAVTVFWWPVLMSALSR
jgi:hypothetical protein